jgi:hypothetical protein
MSASPRQRRHASYATSPRDGRCVVRSATNAAHWAYMYRHAFSPTLIRAGTTAARPSPHVRGRMGRARGQVRHGPGARGGAQHESANAQSLGSRRSGTPTFGSNSGQRLCPSARVLPPFSRSEVGEKEPPRKQRTSLDIWAQWSHIVAIDRGGNWALVTCQTGCSVLLFDFLFGPNGLV